MECVVKQMDVLTTFEVGLNRLFAGELQTIKSLDEEQLDC